MAIRVRKIYCPSCKKLQYQDRAGHYFGCPLQKCKSCGYEYYDPNIIEPATHSKEWFIKRQPNALLIILGWVSAGAALAGFVYFMAADNPPLEVAYISFGMAAAAYIGRIIYTATHTGMKIDAEFEQRYKQSVMRCRNTAYRAFLEEKGQKFDKDCVL